MKNFMRIVTMIIMTIAMTLGFATTTQAKEISKPFTEEEATSTVTTYNLITCRGVEVTTKDNNIEIVTSIDDFVTSSITLSQNDVILVAKFVAATNPTSDNARISMAACPINRVKYGYASSIKEAVSQLADIKEVEKFEADSSSLQATSLAILGLDPEGNFLGEDTLYAYPAGTMTISKKIVDGSYEFFSSEGYNEIFRR